MNSVVLAELVDQPLPGLALPVGLRARRLANTQQLSREEWLAVRRRGIGGSDAAAAVGLNPYKSALELWLEKTGRVVELETPDRDASDSPLYWGTVLEAVVAERYAQQTGRKVRRVNAVLQHPVYRWMLANLDREVVGCDEVQILECKTAGIHGAKFWKDGVPEYVQLQVQHQLAVTGKQAADVAVLIGGQDFQIHRIVRDEELIAQLIALEQEFWSQVEEDIPPSPDGSESADNALAALFPQDSGETVDAREDEALNLALARLVGLQAQLDELMQEDAEIRQRFKARMGEATTLRLLHGEIRWKQAKDSQSLDTKALQATHPDLVSQFRITRPGSRRFTFRVTSD